MVRKSQHQEEGELVTFLPQEVWGGGEEEEGLGLSSLLPRNGGSHLS